MNSASTGRTTAILRRSSTSDPVAQVRDVAVHTDSRARRSACVERHGRALSSCAAGRAQAASGSFAPCRRRRPPASRPGSAIDAPIAGGAANAEQANARPPGQRQRFTRCSSAGDRPAYRHQLSTVTPDHRRRIDNPSSTITPSRSTGRRDPAPRPGPSTHQDRPMFPCLSGASSPQQGQRHAPSPRPPQCRGPRALVTVSQGAPASSTPRVLEQRPPGCRSPTTRNRGARHHTDPHQPQQYEPPRGRPRAHAAARRMRNSATASQARSLVDPRSPSGPRTPARSGTPTAAGPRPRAGCACPGARRLPVQRDRLPATLLRDAVRARHTGRHVPHRRCSACRPRRRWPNTSCEGRRGADHRAARRS